MSPTLVAIVKSIILPPGILLLLLLLCIYTYFKNRKKFIVLSLCTILLLYLFSIPVFSRYLSSIVEPDIAIDLEQIKNSDAEVIIVLGCNRQANAPEFNGDDTVSACTLVRLRYAAILHKLTHLPLLVSGGSVFEETKAEANLMQEVLINELGVNVEWTENKSLNTSENAQFVTELLHNNNINKALLVTHAIHMGRAQFAFSEHGINTYPAPTYFYSRRDHKPFYFEFLPSMQAFYISNMALYEILGYLWMKYGLEHEH